jgi:glycerol-3-phosphate O-acyltransferase
MNSTIEMPLWTALLALLLAALWLLQHFLLPSARWFFRRRANTVIDEVNTRLALKIPSFKLTRREVLIDRLCFHPEIITLTNELSAERQVTRDVLMAEVKTYAEEIVPAFNALLYFKSAYWLARKLVHGLYRVRLGFAEDQELAELDENTSVVFLMNHRSNMDYIVATYLAAERTALSYAVGEWARIWPLQQLIRFMGGYFVRRDSGDPLYRKVLEIYVQMAAQGGVPQAVFPEGRLSRDGKLGPPKLGLLGYITKGFDPQGDRDIVFIPVGINYDRVLEDRSLLHAAEKKPRRAKLATLMTFSAFAGKNIWQALTGRRYRNGYACVNFGKPVFLKQWLRDGGHDLTEPLTDVAPLADDMMMRIGNITPVLPVALVATVITAKPKSVWSELELKAAVFELLGNLEQQGFRAYIPRGNRDYAVKVGIRMLVLRRVLNVENGLYKPAADETMLLNYYANSIAHLVARTQSGHIQVTELAGS